MKKKAFIEEISEMPVSDMYCDSVVSSGNKIYCMGGVRPYRNDVGDWWKQTYTNEAMAYDVVTGQWESLQPMNSGRVFTGCFAINGKIYVLGGVNNQRIPRDVEIYDILTDTWTYGTQMPKPSQNIGRMLAFGKYIYVFGNSQYPATGATQYYTDSYRYDTETDTWASIADLPINHFFVMPVIYNNEIIIFLNNDIYKYDTIGDSYEYVQNCSLPSDKVWIYLKVLDGDIYFVNSNEYGQTIFQYDILNDQFTEVIKGKFYCNHATAEIDGKWYFVGSWDTVKDPRVINNKIHVLSFKNVLSVLMEEGEETQLSVHRNLTENSNYTWTSTIEAVAKVDNAGVVTAVSPGRTEIHAVKADEAYEEFIDVKVVPEGEADEQRLALDLNLGESQALHFSDTPGTNWLSYNASKASVTAGGVVTGEGVGLTIVEAQLGNETDIIYVRVR